MGYTELFHGPAVTSVSFRLVTKFLGTLWSFFKQINAPYVFDWEHGIALQAMQGNGASSRSEGEVSLFFPCCSGTWGIFSSYGGDDPSKLVFVQRR